MLLKKLLDVIKAKFSHNKEDEVKQAFHKTKQPLHEVWNRVMQGDLKIELDQVFEMLKKEELSEWQSYFIRVVINQMLSYLNLDNLNLLLNQVQSSNIKMKVVLS